MVIQLKSTKASTTQPLPDFSADFHFVQEIYSETSPFSKKYFPISIRKGCELQLDCLHPQAEAEGADFYQNIRSRNWYQPLFEVGRFSKSGNGPILPDRLKTFLNLMIVAWFYHIRFFTFQNNWSYEYETKIMLILSSSFPNDQTRLQW